METTRFNVHYEKIIQADSQKKSELLILYRMEVFQKNPRITSNFEFVNSTACGD